MHDRGFWLETWQNPALEAVCVRSACGPRPGPVPGSRRGVEHDTAGGGGMTWPGKTALDAHTDQALAAVRDARREGLDPAAAELGDELAGMLREQFPGQHELAGRVLMAATTAVTSYGKEIEARGDSLRTHPWALINLLGFTAEALTSGGEP